MRLAERGYPAHWLGTVLENFTSGVIRTTARAHREEVSEPGDVSKIHSLRQVTVAPWVAELPTLVGVWRDLMPFGFVVASLLQVLLTDVCEYSVTFSYFKGRNIQLRVPHFILVLYNSELGKTSQMLRMTVLDDEVGDNSEDAKQARTEGLRVITTLR